MPRFPLALATLCCFSPLASAAGNVWIVDDEHTPGAHFQSLGHALQVAASGAVILVRDGIYSSFPDPAWIVTSKSLTIAAESGHAPVLVDGLRVQLSANHELLVRGLQIVPPELSGVPALTAFAGVSGGKSRAVLLEDCAVGAIDLRTLGATGASFAAVDCTIGAFTPDSGLGQPALSIEGNWSAALYRCSVNGFSGASAVAFGALLGGNGGSAVELRNGATLFAMSCLLDGGGGGAGASSATACGAGGNGGDAVRLHGAGSRVESQATLLTPGAGGVSGGAGCSSGQAGVGITDPAAWTLAPGGPHLLTGGLSACIGQLVTITLEAQPLETVFLYSGADLLSQSILALGPYWLADPVKVIGHATVPASGAATYTFQVPPLGAGNLGARIYLQAYCYDPFSSRFALTSPTAIVALDPSVPSFP